MVKGNMLLTSILKTYLTLSGLGGSSRKSCFFANNREIYCA